jgi:hypothetical protein
MDIGEVNPVILVCQERFEVRHVVLIVVERHKHVRTVAVGSTDAKDNLVRHWLGNDGFILAVNIVGALVLSCCK